jgi:hypothetical protein
MAYLIFNPDGNLETCVKEKADLNLIRGDVAYFESNGWIKEVSREDYKTVVCREKEAKLRDGNLIIEQDPELDNNYQPVSMTQEMFQEEVNRSIEFVTNFMNRHAVKLATSEFSSLNTRLNDFKTGLENIDFSSITFPVTTRLLRYWFDNQSIEPFTIRYLQ